MRCLLFGKHGFQDLEYPFAEHLGTGGIEMDLVGAQRANESTCFIP